MKNPRNVGASMHDKQLETLIQQVVDLVTSYAEKQILHIKKLTEIGLSLSSENDLKRLFDLIVDEAISLLNADAGTLYLVDREGGNLEFVVVQNKTLNIRMGGRSKEPVTFPKVPLFISGKPNYNNVSSYSALIGETVNIDDVYTARGFDFTGPRKYDNMTGYRSKSMLVIPMKNHERDIIGVLQMVNAKDPSTDEIIPFTSEHIELAKSLATQAAIAVTNTQLIRDLQDLFEAFIKSIATAIDEKSPYTGGHIKRVADLTMEIARKITEQKEGNFKDVNIEGNQKEALKLASWMHDVGKITTPEWVVDKPTKLFTVIDRVDVIEQRFDLIKKCMEADLLRSCVEKGDVDAADIEKAEKIIQKKKDQLDKDLEFIKVCNLPGEFMSEEKVERIKDISKKVYSSSDGDIPYLTPEEVERLLIKKGSLTDEERNVVQHHAEMTRRILENLPFPKKLKHVPWYAAGHHERLDGSGYPDRLKGDEIPIEMRIMAIADVFEALTAKDRPYKKPMKLSQALKIMEFMKKDKHIDSDIFDLFMKEKIYLSYAEKEMSQDQIDI